MSPDSGDHRGRTPPEQTEQQQSHAPSPNEAGRGIAHLSLRMARRIAVGVIGATVVLFGVVMVVTPGPAIVVIPVGLSILALEFAWARRLLTRFQQQASRARDSWFSRRN